MVTGRVPFEGATSSDVIGALLDKDPLPLTECSADVPIELDQIVAKALRKNPEERYQTVNELLVDLKTLKQDLEERAKARAGPTGEVANADARSLWSKIHHHRRAGLSALAIVLIAAVSLVYFPSGGKAIDSVAVLPFVNANADPQTEYLADGIPESIINSLSQLPHLKVLSRSSAFPFKGQETNAQEVGRKLGVKAVLTGKVEQDDESLVISLELVDVRDNSQICGQRY
jgi:TolB-like protein